ncbi:hypothetical protein [Algibacillus agarilyticus]|uniref:hypothetical protein n=1 Tax=Algibacillus agarilyticus TaxID=2234133 RepID=UPI000DCFBC83|nr:hypothetical protein [Algibacillus agarilyticus]
MDIYSKIKDCDESELFDLVMSDDNLHVDGSFGLIEYLKPNYPELENLYQLDDEGEKLLRIAEVIVGHKLLFVTQSNGSDTLAFKVVSDTSYDQCIKQFGMPFAENYVPVYIPKSL